jgi:hypothetical protein
VDAIDAALSAHRLIVLEDVQVSIEGEYEGGEVRVTRAWPTARDRHPDARLPDDAIEAAARLTARIRAAGRVRVDSGTLYTGREATLHAEDAMLLPFGAIAGPR